MEALDSIPNGEHLGEVHTLTKKTVISALCLLAYKHTPRHVSGISARKDGMFTATKRLKLILSHAQIRGLPGPWFSQKLTQIRL